MIPFSIEELPYERVSTARKFKQLRITGQTLFAVVPENVVAAAARPLGYDLRHIFFLTYGMQSQCTVVDSRPRKR